LTATAVLLLAEEGELRLDDPVSAYLDGLPDWAEDITVDNLVHHTSGLPDYVDLLLEGDSSRTIRRPKHKPCRR
jgi:CubicO group peptidase (beta-lactamase class C family)